MMEINQRELAPGVQLLAVQTNKFKTSLLGVTLFDRLSEKTAAENALIPPLLYRGSRVHPDMESISAALDELYGGSIEPMVRKKGEIQCLGYVGSFLDDAYVPEATDILGQAASLLGEILLEPKGEETGFDPKYLDSEKQNLIDRIRGRINDKQQYAMYRLINQMCSSEAFGVDKLGEEAQAAAITNQTAWARYQALIKRAPVFLYYCGSAPIDQVESAYRKAFAPLLTGERSALPDGLDQAGAVTEATRYFEDRMDVTQGKLSMGFRLGKDCTSPAELAPVQIFNALFGGSTNSKLFLNVRERLSLCYYASSLLEKFMGMVFVSSGVAFDKYEQARDEILAQLDDCRKGKITTEELESARRFLVNHMKTTLDTQGRLEDYWLGQAVAGKQDAPEALVELIEQVTLEQVRQVADALKLDSVYFLNGKEARNQ